MATLNDFEALWQAAANSWGSARGGAGHIDAWHLDGIFSPYYPNYGLSTRSGTPRYNVTGNNTQTEGVYSQTFTNDTANPTTGNFSYTDDFTESFTVALTEGLTIADTISVNLSVDGLGVSNSLAVTVDLSSTQTWAKSETKSWKIDQAVPEPPHSTTIATLNVEETTLSGSASVPITVNGSVAIGLNNKWNDHYFWFVAIGSILKETNNVPSWITVNSDASVTYTATYQLDGVVSKNAYVTLSSPGALPQILPIDPPGGPKLWGASPTK